MRFELTTGERRLIEAYLATALVAALVAVMVVCHLATDAVSLAPPSPYLAWVFVSGAVAGAAGLRVVRDRVGRPGVRGVVGTLGAALVATFVAGLVGGSLALPVYGTMFGPFSLAVTLAATPGLALAWSACFVLAHLNIRHWHVERDSIFHYRRRT